MTPSDGSKSHSDETRDRPQAGIGPIRIVDHTELEALVDTLVDHLAHEYGDTSNLALIGIHRRGDALAERLREALESRLSREVLCGALDITLYRDDFDSLQDRPMVGQTHIPFALNGRTIVLVDDVLFTGRTVRAALDELVDLGRPDRIALAVLIDRGWRELPICADFVGKVVITERDEDVQVRLREVDARDEVVLIIPAEGSRSE